MCTRLGEVCALRGGGGGGGGGGGPGLRLQLHTRQGYHGCVCVWACVWGCGTLCEAGLWHTRIQQGGLRLPSSPPSTPTPLAPPVPPPRQCLLGDDTPHVITGLGIARGLEAVACVHPNFVYSPDPTTEQRDAFEAYVTKVVQVLAAARGGRGGGLVQTAKQVLLLDDVLHFLFHTLNAKPDAVDSRRHAVHLAVEAPKVVQNLVVLLDGLELQRLCRTLRIRSELRRTSAAGTCRPTCIRSTSLRSFSMTSLLSFAKSFAPTICQSSMQRQPRAPQSTKCHTCPSRPFSSYLQTQSESTAVSFVMCSITACWLSSVPAEPEPFGHAKCMRGR